MSYEPTLYEESSIVSQWHSIYRFGHSDGFSNIASSDYNTAMNYIEGTLFIGLFLLSVFVVFSVIIFLRDCGCKKNCQRMDSIKESDLVWKLVAFSSLGIIEGVCIILYLAIGTPLAQSTLDKAMNTNEEANSILYEVDSALSTIDTIGTDAISTRDLLLGDLQNFCPNYEDIDEAFNINLQDTVDKLILSLEDLANFATFQSENLREDVDLAIETNDEVADGLNQLEESYTGVAYTFISITFLFLYLSAGSILELTGVKNIVMKQMTSLLALPLLFLVLLFSVFLAGLFSSSSIMVADFCNGGTSPASPAASIIAILDERDYKNRYIDDGIDYFLIRNCAGEFPYDFLTQFLDELEAAATTADEFSTTINQIGIETVNMLCEQDISSIVDDVATFTTTTVEELVVLTTSLTSDGGLLTCERLLPLYEEGVHEGICSDFMSVWNATFFVMLSIFILGLTMLIVRPVDNGTSKVSSMEEEHNETINVKNETQKRKEPIVSAYDNAGIEIEI